MSVSVCRRQCFASSKIGDGRCRSKIVDVVAQVLFGFGSGTDSILFIEQD